MRPLAFFFTLPLAASACFDDVSPKLELRMTVTIPPGTEVEYCRFVTVPEMWITKETVEFTPGSHHAGTLQTPYTSIPTHKLDGTPVDTSGVFDCSEGPLNSWSVTKPIGGSQNLVGGAILSFPEGVGMRVSGVLLMDAHYLNSSDAPLEADVKIVYDTTPAERIVYEGDILGMSNPLISVPPGSSARARWRCPVHRDITIVNAQSHMHARGVGFQARVDGNAPFYVTDRWESVPVQEYEGLAVKAGSVLDFQCDYRNTESTPFYMGPRTTDEMCMLIGSYYPADPRISSCLDEAGEAFGGEWIGQGTATCEQTMGCLHQAQGLPAMTDCMLAASPSVSRESSELLRCLLRARDPLAECGPQSQDCAGH